jgi:hypothetical protein
MDTARIATRASAPSLELAKDLPQRKICGTKTVCNKN